VSVGENDFPYVSGQKGEWPRVDDRWKKKSAICGTRGRSKDLHEKERK